MTITNRDKKLLVYLAAFAIIAVAYFFVYTPYMEKYQTISQERDELQLKLDHLNEIYMNKDQYEKRTAEAQVKYNETVSKFYGNLDQDRTLMMIDHLENNTNIWIGRVSFSEPEILGGDGSVAVEAVEGETTETEPVVSSSLAATKQSLSIDYSGKYSDFKKFIEYVNNFDKRLFISSMTAGYSSDSNEVSGTIVMTQYSIDSPDKEAETPDLSSVGTGVENIFTSLTGEGNIDEGSDGITVNSLELNEDTNTEDNESSEDSNLPEETTNEEESSGEETNEAPEEPEQSQQNTDENMLNNRPRRAG